MEHLTIGEVARRAGIRTSAIRFYESVDLLPPAARASGQRRYDTAVLDQLAVIRLAQEAGFTVAEIRQMLTGFDPETPPSTRWRSLAERKLSEIDRLIARAQAMKRLLEEGLRCGCLAWEECAVLARAAEIRGGGEGVAMGSAE
jgi:MerR family transcriptional regulator, redox-sensitive transcriptional activator SoxR